jgi:lipid-binding SYLF domain-containing protein
MKTKLILAFLTAALSGNVWAVDRADLDQRVRTLTAKFEALQDQPDKQIPADLLRQAQGLILLDRTKAGFLFAFQGGGGVAMVRNPTTQEWGPVGFIKANEASLGPQIGGEQNFFVIVLSDTNSTRLLIEPRLQINSEVRSTAGQDSAGLDGRISKPRAPVQVFDDRKGLFAGADVKIGALSPDDQANYLYYGQPVTLEEILFENKVVPTEAAKELAAKITANSTLAKR